MAASPPNATFLPPDRRLKSKVGDCDQTAHETLVASGNAAAGECRGGISEVVAELVEVLRDTSAADGDNTDILENLAHDLRGLAANGGQPGVGLAAAALWRYAAAARDVGGWDPRLSRLHVDAIAALHNAGASAQAAGPVLSALTDAVQRGLAHGADQDNHWSAIR